MGRRSRAVAMLRRAASGLAADGRRAAAAPLDLYPPAPRVTKLSPLAPPVSLGDSPLGTAATARCSQLPPRSGRSACRWSRTSATFDVPCALRHGAATPVDEARALAQPFSGLHG